MVEAITAPYSCKPVSTTVTVMKGYLCGIKYGTLLLSPHLQTEQGFHSTHDQRRHEGLLRRSLCRCCMAAGQGRVGGLYAPGWCACAGAGVIVSILLSVTDLLTCIDGRMHWHGLNGPPHFVCS